jgi:hypothetical protein
MLAATFAASSFAAGDNCPAVNQLSTKAVSDVVFYDYSGIADSATGNTTFTYLFSGEDPNNAYTGEPQGIPGLITYCVYPQGGNLPNSLSVDVGAVGADGEQFVAKMAAKGSFSFTRADGDKSNIPFDGALYTMGTATWKGACTTDLISSVTTCVDTSAATQTILLHINDPQECSRLYNTEGATTCWVFPTSITNRPPPPDCNGDVACKSAVIDQATGDYDDQGYPIVPMFTQLNIHYTYVIRNPIGSGVNMWFNVPTPSTKDINAGGGKDYFGCEQIPDPAGGPGGFITVNNYQNTGLQLKFFSSSGTCGQSRFQLTNSDPGAPAQFTLVPGNTISFTVDMVTRKNKSGKYEYTSAGPHILNSGFTVKWFQDGPSSACANWVSRNTLCSFSTGINPLYVDAQP